MRNAFVETTTELLDERDDVALVLADISASLFKQSGATGSHPYRVMNVGIREQLMVSVAAGMALEGMRPIVHSYTPFLVERAYEQIKLDLGHQGVGAILVSIGASYDDPGSGRTHAAPEDIAIINALPDWTVYVPGHPHEVRMFLRGAADRTDKIYIRLDGSSNAGTVERPDALTLIRTASPDAPLVVAVGPMLDRAIEAVDGLDVAVAYTAAPLNQTPKDLADLATGDDVIVVEPATAGTSLGQICNQINDRPRRFLGIGVPLGEHRLYGSVTDHEVHHRLDTAGIRQQITRWIG
jgi:transketolase